MRVFGTKKIILSVCTKAIMTITRRQLECVERVPHVFHGSDLMVHENGIIVTSTRQQATEQDVEDLASNAMYHLDVARRTVLRLAFHQWSLSSWEIVDLNA